MTATIFQIMNCSTIKNKQSYERYEFPVFYYKKKYQKSFELENVIKCCITKEKKTSTCSMLTYEKELELDIELAPKGILWLKRNKQFCI